MVFFYLIITFWGVYQKDKDNIFTENSILEKQYQKLDYNLEQIIDNLKYEYKDGVYNI